MLAKRPDEATRTAFLAPGDRPDRIEIIDDVAYLLCATRYCDLKINNAFIERKLGVAATTRVHRTLARLVALSDGKPPDR